MELVVLKFGGTSVDTHEHRLLAAKHILRKLKSGNMPLVIVSAIGRNGMPYATDTLINFALEPYPEINPREHDLLVSCGEIISTVLMVQTLNHLRVKANALTGSQAGIITNGDFGQSRVKWVNPKNILWLLGKGIVPVIAGFQGVTEAGETTTLGRGGSDTTASIVGAAVRAKGIEIYTDVDGIMTADPKIVKKSQVIGKANYNEVCELAYKGTKVIHPRAVEIAHNAGIPITVRSTFTNSPGTLVFDIDYDKPVTGITSQRHITFVRVTPKQERDYATGIKLFSLLADRKISVDFIDIRPHEITFIICEAQKNELERALTDQEFKFSCSDEFAKVSVVGAGMTGVPGILAKIVNTLANHSIQIYQATDSHTSISCLIKKKHENRAVNSLHSAFELFAQAHAP